jgi:hypothetical protein
MHFPLRKGTEVLLAFIDGDPDRPVIAGTVPNPETPSVVTSKNKECGGIRFAKGSQLSFLAREDHNCVFVTTSLPSLRKSVTTSSSPSGEDESENMIQDDNSVSSGEDEAENTIQDDNSVSSGEDENEDENTIQDDKSVSSDEDENEDENTIQDDKSVSSDEDEVENMIQDDKSVFICQSGFLGEEILAKSWDITNLSGNSIFDVTYHKFGLCSFVDLFTFPLLQNSLGLVIKKNIKNILDSQNLEGRENSNWHSVLGTAVNAAAKVIQPLIITAFKLIITDIKKKEALGVKLPEGIWDRINIGWKDAIIIPSLMRDSKIALFKVPDIDDMEIDKDGTLGNLGKLTSIVWSPVWSTNYGINIISSCIHTGSGLKKKLANFFRNLKSPMNINTIRIEESTPNILLCSKNGVIDILADNGINMWTPETTVINSKNLKINIDDNVDIKSIKNINIKSKDNCINLQAKNSIVVKSLENEVIIAGKKNIKLKSTEGEISSEAKKNIKLKSTEGKITFEAEKDDITLKSTNGKIFAKAKEVTLNVGNTTLKITDNSVTINCNNKVKINGKNVQLG